ncbi:unnamed protein product [Linum tenue]|uniref:Uncharacterized protein n=1 Tax=Linum tenue TaxID=586396 RepID=A0AAV0QE62_9ROSI|nr:unnamed protein product [Linum tenue]
MADSIASMVVQCALHGSLSIHDTVVERRPYHRNCECALHKKNAKSSGIWCSERNLSFPKKARGSLVISASSSGRVNSRSIFVGTSRE